MFEVSPPITGKHICDSNSKQITSNLNWTQTLRQYPPLTRWKWNSGGQHLETSQMYALVVDPTAQNVAQLGVRGRRFQRWLVSFESRAQARWTQKSSRLYRHAAAKPEPTSAVERACCRISREVRIHDTG